MNEESLLVLLLLLLLCSRSEIKFHPFHSAMAASTLFFFFIFIFIHSSFSSATPPSFSTRKFQTSKLMQRLNKTPIKTIQSSDGDVIDCIHISEQPTMDHPFLKDHKIQMAPEVQPYSVAAAGEEGGGPAAPAVRQTWKESGECPENSVPVRRTKEEDVMRASSVKRYGRKRRMAMASPFENQLDSVPQNAHKHAIAYAEGRFYGAKASINVWNPTIQGDDHLSLSQIWLLAGSFGADLNSIEAGWQVNPQLYGDNKTRIFIYWTADAYKSTGCYNLVCSGFIQVSRDIAIGATIAPISDYTKNQYDISIMIWKDPTLRNWWMQFENTVVGYWPDSLFSNLGGGSTVVEFGGEVAGREGDIPDEGGKNPAGPTTQMGSGHYAEEGFGRASYIRNIMLVDQANQLVQPSALDTYTDADACYNVRIGMGSRSWGNHFYFGGPGTGSKCT